MTSLEHTQHAHMVAGETASATGCSSCCCSCNVLVLSASTSCAGPKDQSRMLTNYAKHLTCSRAAWATGDAKQSALPLGICNVSVRCMPQQLAH
jgi:hypothetical protein